MPVFRSEKPNYTILFLLFFMLPLVRFAWSAEREAGSFFTTNPDDSLAVAREFIDSWFSRDKGLHLAGSLMTTVAISKSLQHFGNTSSARASYWGVGLSFSLGLGKEIYDHRKPSNRFSYKDLTADIVGIVIGVIIVSIP
jgi:putative lipoprotein